MATCPNKSLADWKVLVKAQGEDNALFLWDKYEGNVPVEYNTSLDEKLVNGFLKDFGVTVSQYNDLKEDLGIDSYTASDLVAKAIAYKKGQTITSEVAYFAYSMLGQKNNKIRSNLRYLVHKWSKYQERFNYHSDLIKEKEGFINDKKEWQNTVRDRVIVDFLKEHIEDYYKDPKAFEKSLDTRWIRGIDKFASEDYTIWESIVKFFEDILANFSSKHKNREEQLQDLGRTIAEEILNRNYEYFNYELGEEQIQKYYNKTIASDSFAKNLVEFGQKSLGFILTGSLALRRAGSVFRTVSETLHDIDWVIPYGLNNSDVNKDTTVKMYEYQQKYIKAVKELNPNSSFYPEDIAKLKETLTRESLAEVENFDWFKKFKEKYPTYELIGGFYGGEHGDFESFTVQGVIDPERYPSLGTHKEIRVSYTKDPKTKAPIAEKKEILVPHLKGEIVKETGYVIDFFIRLQENQEEHENYFKLWKEIMIAKLKMGRDKDFIDWKAFVPYIKSQDSFNFNYAGFRHFNYDFSERNALEDPEEQATSNIEERALLSNVMQQKAEMPASRASNETLAKLKQIIAKMGVKIDTLENYLKGNPDVQAKGANALADLVQGIIAIAEGKENVATTEEMVHIATAMIEQVSPKTVTEMISKIDRFKIYKQVLATYSSDPNYQLPNGKPDIRKLKKEAVDKLIAEVIIRQSEGSTEFPELLEEENRTLVAKWWQIILDWFRGQYKKSNIEIFEKTAERISSGKVGATYGSEKDYKVWHASNEKISSFIANNINGYFVKEKKGSPKAIFFTGEKAPEESFLSKREYQQEFSVNMENPLIVDTEEGYSREKESFKELVDRALENGYDGVIIKNVDDNGFNGDVYISLDAEKILPIFKGEGIFLQKDQQYSDAQIEAQQRILADQNRIKKIEDTTTPVDPLLLDTEEASNYYVLENPDGTETKITKRVTDLVKQWYVDRFGKDKKFTEAEKKFNELKRKYGVEFHNIFELVHGRYFNSDGTRRDSVSSRNKIADPTVSRIYTEIENYYVELIDSFSKDGKNPLVFSEVKIFDPKEQRAGTIDLLIIDESGKGHIFDWKFMSVAPTQDDVPWFKQGAYNVQLGKYKEMLMKNYGIKEFGNIRAIPILMDFKYDNRKVNSTLTIAGIKIGSTDATKIEDMRLVPVSEESESTGVELLDNLISQLNSVLRQVGKTKATSDEEREFKKERLNILRKAIRAAQTTQNIAPLVNVISIMRREGDRLVNDWNMIYDKKPASSDDIDNPELSKFAADIREYIAIGEVFKNVDRLIGDLIYNSQMEKEATTKAQKKEIRQRLQDRQYISEEATAIFNSLEDVKKMGGKFANKFMGERNLVRGLLKPEAVWKSLSGRFRGATDSPLASIQILTKLVTNSKGRAAQQAVKEVEELMSIRELLAKKGGDLRALIQQIYQKDDKGGLVNKLIRKYQKDFYEKVDENAGENLQSKKWLMNNIDVEAYKKEATEMLKSRIRIIKNNHEDDINLQEKLIEQERNKWDITSKTFNGWNNYIIKRHPLDKWHTEEYTDLEKNPDLHKLYLFIEKMNNKANDMGYIENAAKSTFIPFVRKSMAESLSWDFSLSAITNFGDNFKLRADDVGYGAINELTKELEHAIPKYYTYDFSVKEDKDGNVIHDYSEVSEDLFKNMILYINHMNNYKYLSEVEDQLQLVKTIETFKKHLNTNTTGDVIFENGKPQELEGNKENAKIFDDFMRALLYEEKYPLSDGDTPLNISTRDAVKKLINKVAGKEVYTIEENPDAKSLTKTLDTANKAFQLKTLGFEPISGLVNWFGNNIQLATQSGIYFKGREIIKNEFKLFGNRFKNDDDREMFIQLINHFMPLKDDPNYEELKKAGISTLTRQNFSDMLMWFMREPEQHMEKTIFLTLLDNTMVVDGKLVNIREFVKNKYKNRYDSGEAYRNGAINIEKEIEELQKTNSISATRTLVNGKVSIPGFDFNNLKEVQRLSTLSKRIARNATGGMTQTDINKMNMNVWTKSMMVFKGWIPKLLDTRFGEFRKVSDDFSVVIDENGLTTGEKYDIGRVRLFGQFLHLNPLLIIKDINDVLSVNEDGLSKIDALYVKYAESYRKQTGEDLEMDRAEFADLMRTNLRNQVKELATLFALIGLGMSLGFFAPDEDDDKAAKNRFRWTQKVVDKFTSEISFFYNPAEIEKLLSGNAFPAISLFADAFRFLNNLGMESTGLDWSDHTKTVEEVREDAQPVKYLAKMLPVAKSVFTYGAIFSEDFAKEFDITIQKESKR